MHLAKLLVEGWRYCRLVGVCLDFSFRWLFYLSDGVFFVPDDGLVPMCACPIYSEDQRIEQFNTWLFLDFVAHDPATESIVVAHQGTSRSSL